MNDPAKRGFAILRTVVFSALFLGFVAGWLPWKLGALRPDAWSALARGVRQPWRSLGLIPMFAGLALGLWCAFDFAWVGRGTPAPFDPPRKLVITGLYRYARNPMYLAAALGLLGEWVALGAMRFVALWYALALIIWVSVVVKLEERVLTKMFGDDFREYCRNVPRWLPRTTPWKQQKRTAAGG